MTGQQRLIQQSKSDEDNVMMLVSCDGVFPCIHFDDGHDSPDHISSFQVTASDPVPPIESLQTSPMVPTSDVESLHSPQAGKWEIARQEELMVYGRSQCYYLRVTKLLISGSFMLSNTVLVRIPLSDIKQGLCSRITNLQRHPLGRSRSARWLIRLPCDGFLLWWGEGNYFYVRLML